MTNLLRQASYLLLFALFMTSCYTPQNARMNQPRHYNMNNSSGPMANSTMPMEPGKCFARAQIVDEYEVVEKELIVYTGKNNNVSGVEYQKVVFRPAKSVWEKKINDNCLSSDPNDCLVWCLVEIPEESENYYVVTDTSIVQDYELKRIEKTVLISKGGYTEWKEVVCKNDVSLKFIKNVQHALHKEGHGTDLKVDGEFDKEWKTAMIDFQKKNYLPVGNLNMETLNHLKVDI